jgi:hypothetical protein
MTGGTDRQAGLGVAFYVRTAFVDQQTKMLFLNGYHFDFRIDLADESFDAGKRSRD